MSDAVNDNFSIFNLEQDAVVAYSQTIFWSEARQMLDISLQIIFHKFHFFENPRLYVGWQFLQIFNGFWFQDSFVFQARNPLVLYLA